MKTALKNVFHKTKGHETAPEHTETSTMQGLRDATTTTTVQNPATSVQTPTTFQTTHPTQTSALPQTQTSALPQTQTSALPQTQTSALPQTQALPTTTYQTQTSTAPMPSHTTQTAAYPTTQASAQPEIYGYPGVQTQTQTSVHTITHPTSMHEATPTSTQPFVASTRVNEPTVVHGEVRERAEVVQEVVKPVEVVEVQPVVDVQRQQLEIHQVVQPVHITEQAPLQVHENVKPGQYYERREQISPEKRMALESGFSDISGGTTRMTIEREMHENAPIVHEHVQRKIVQEIQPVIHKEIVEPHLVKEVIPITERIEEAPIVIKEVRQPIVKQSNVLPGA